MYDLGELLGRYVLTGIILWAALFIMLLVRLIWVAFAPGNGGLKFLDMFSPVKEGEKAKTTKKDVACYVLWPYGLIVMIHQYFKREQYAIEQMQKLNNGAE